MDDLHEQHEQHQPQRASPSKVSNPAGKAPSQVATSIAEQVKRRANLGVVGNTVAATLAQEMGHLLDGLPDGVLVTDDAGRIQLVNRQTEALFGYEREALLGQSIELLMPERFRSTHPSHRAHFAAQPRTRPMGTGLQLFGLRRDCSEFPVEISLSPISVADQSLVLATIRDVTTQRLLEQQAREGLTARLTMLQAILDELPTGAYLARGYDAELVLANRQVAAIWGAAWPEGQPMRQFLATSRARIFDLQGRELPLERLVTIRALRSRQSVRQHREIIRRADGTALSVLVNAIALDPQVFPHLSEVRARPNDPVPVVLVVHQDIGALAEAEQLKDEFVALAAHELRNPIASLLGYAQVLLQAVSPQAGRHAGTIPDAPAAPATDTDDVNETGSATERRAPAIPHEWQEEAVQAVMESSRRLAALTDDMLDATRLQANRLELRPEPLELGALVRRVIKRVQVTTRAHSIEVTVPSEPLLVHADVQRVEQVLTNLLSNAIKYTPDGGCIEVTARLTHRAITAEDEQESADVAQVAVRDHGLGIPANQQDRIFGRFARADNVRERGIAGTGLGLYVSRELIERQGGRLWFESAEGAGTTFTFELPRWTEPTDEDGSLA